MTRREKRRKTRIFNANGREKCSTFVFNGEISELALGKYCSYIYMYTYKERNSERDR